VLSLGIAIVGATLIALATARRSGAPHEEIDAESRARLEQLLREAEEEDRP
jgi:cytochrome c-type biogenesis protein CcmH/NrfF